MRLYHVIGVLFATAALIACGSPFDSKSEIQKLRVLAIKASLPTLEPGDTTSLSALIASPDGRDFTLRWEICLFTAGANDRFECPENPGDNPLAPPNMLASGEGDTIDFTYDPQLTLVLQFLCEQTAAFADQIPEGFPLPTCDLGYPLRVRMIVTETATGDELYAVKTLYLDHKPSEKPVELNRNPRLEGLVAEDAGAVPKTGTDVRFRCILDPTTLEMFTPIGDEETRDEEVLFSWFSTAGLFEDELSLFSPVGKTLEEAELNILSLDDVDPGAVRVWCVARDGRGGMDWAELEFNVVD